MEGCAHSGNLDGNDGEFRSHCPERTSGSSPETSCFRALARSWFEDRESISRLGTTVHRDRRE